MTWVTRAIAVVLMIAGSTVLTRAGAEPPRVVASIMPVHSIVAAVMEGVGTPHLLVRGSGSPHAYSMRPSDARALEDADLVVWVGPELETFLTRALETVPERARLLTLMEAEGVTLHRLRTGEAWDGHAHGTGHAHDEKHGHEDKHDHDHDGREARDEKHGHDDGHGHAREDKDHAQGGIDAHIWLDPLNGRVLARVLADALAEVDPARAETYRANADAYAARLESLDGEVRDALAPVADRPYIVFHDAYQYFETRYGLNARGAVTLSPERAPGADRLREVRHVIEETGAVCVFAEPQFSPRVLQAITENLDVRQGVLDPLGADLEPGPDAYPTLLRNMA